MKFSLSVFCLLLFITVASAQQTRTENKSAICYLPDATYRMEGSADWMLIKKGNQFTEKAGKNKTVSLARTNPDYPCTYFLEVVKSSDPQIKPGFRYINQVLGGFQDQFEIKTLTAKQGKYLTLIKIKQP